MLTISMKKEKALSLDQVRAFVAGNPEIEFEASNAKETYQWITETLVEHEYHRQKRADKGLVRSYLAKMTGLSRSQVTRLIKRYVGSGTVERRVSSRQKFAKRYTNREIELLAEVDEAHETLSGPATSKILYRELHEYNNEEFRQLAYISVGHIYNIRQSATYRKRRVVYQKTKPVTVGIGERRKPDPQGGPGFLRVDTVHQGDQDGVKGVYHINAVDEVTQWQVVGAVEQISEAWLIPVLEQIIEQFPFTVRGFHSDNGSEFINHKVAELLNKLLAKQTKSRARRSNDNGLVETKNGAIVRKHMGHGYIDAKHAGRINEFYRNHFNPYLNFHRPCGVREIKTDKNGKQKIVYKWYATPWEILRQLPSVSRWLKNDVTVSDLNRIARQVSDTESAKEMQTEKGKLFTIIFKKQAA